MIKVGQEDMTGKRDSKKVLLKLLLTRAKKQTKQIRPFVFWENLSAFETNRPLTRAFPWRAQYRFRRD